MHQFVLDNKSFNLGPQPAMLEARPTSVATMYQFEHMTESDPHAFDKSLSSGSPS